jgi:hypothetical protein
MARIMKFVCSKCSRMFVNTAMLVLSILYTNAFADYISHITTSLMGRVTTCTVAANGRRDVS